YSNLKTKHTYNLGKGNIYVREVDGHRLLGSTLVVQATIDKTWTVSAEEAELHLVPDEGKLVARFHNFALEGLITYNDPDTFEYVMSVEDLTGSTQKNRSPSTYALAEITPAIQEQEKSL